MALRSYRSFLRVIAGMPPQQRVAAIAEARIELHAHRDVADESEVTRLVENFDSRVAFLRMTTSQRRRSQSGKTRVIYGADGTKRDVGTARDKAKYTNWDGSNMDPDSVARHNHSLARMGFRDNAHAKGIF